jgi:hypothetical protein
MPYGLLLNTHDARRNCHCRVKTEESHPFMPQKEKYFSGTLEN